MVSVDAPARAEVPVAELRGAGRTFDGPSPVTALRPTDLSIYAGDWIAVTGRSGSGKSTLLHLLGLLDRPTTGTYLLDGIDTAAMSDRERTRLRARHIGFVFQSFHLLAHRSALENVMLSLMYAGCPRSQRAARAAEAARREAAEAIQRAEQARADAMRAGLDLRSAIPDLQNLGSEFDRLRDGVVPLVPGPGGTSTSPVTPLRPGSSTSASSVVSLGGRTAGVGDVVLTPTAPSPALGGTTAASGAAGTAATEGMVPFMPPMMGGMPAAVGGGGGSGGGGGGPLGGRSIRRGGPRLVDPEEGKGPAALTGRATDKRRESVKPATLETEGWVTEPTSATPVSQPAPRVTRGAVS